VSEEPKHKYWDIEASKWIAGYAHRLTDGGVVGLWQIVIDGRRWFGLEGDRLADYVRRSLEVLVESGAKPVKEIDSEPDEYYWTLQRQYGATNADIIDNVMGEWRAGGSQDSDPNGIWFAFPKICDRRQRRDGLERMLDFLDFLSEKGIQFFITREREDALMVTFTLVGARVEVEFFVNHIEFCYFRGSEGVECDPKALYGLIRENWD
jgi:hypothetical protein